ncbi:TetR/AcrR family transcriptional regulator [Streptomyces sp. MZ04]|uniref:TetR/AcrR family transcriptional regulator n=1 Tax=Streptomyces sp. MZ04 TaxID=2559236 RepID=UPI00107E8D3C|nr:TetR/AcrR family transcriptional regulator [Streptomyces sp. MZ04]TGB01162.1 TetR/AcrR family transcriptional regulator [Streptomyces sp. MZ04]
MADDDTKARGAARQPRADARRNRERILEAARKAYAEAGPETSLNEIARRAGVGPGTLYRHFPSRAALLTAVLEDRVETLCGRTEELLAADSADDALDDWLRAFLAHARVNQGLGGALLIEELETPDALGFDCHQRIRDTASSLLTRAQTEGTARKDLLPADMVQLVVGIAVSTPHSETDPAQPERLLALTLDAIHAA